MKSYIAVAGTDGTFDIPGGTYGYALKPTLKRSVPPSSYTNPQFEGIPGQFPVSLRSLERNISEAQLVSNADTVYSNEPLPAMRVSECEPESMWRVVLMERPGETWRQAEDPALAVVSLGSVTFDGTFFNIDLETRGIIIRPSYRALILYFKQQTDGTGGNVRMFVKDTQSNIWKTGPDIDTSVEPVAVRQVLAPGGEVFLQADYVGTCTVEATVEIG
jgi:hypothetical protein